MVLRLQVEARAEGIGVDPRNPPLIWEVWNGEGWMPTRIYEDTTGGLNRAGEIVLLVPVEHEPLTVANESAYWLRARLLAPRTGQPTYRNSPRVRGLEVSALGGTVGAEHAETIGQRDRSAAATAPPGRPSRSTASRCCPGATARRSRIVDGDRVDVVDGGRGLLRRPARATSHFVWDSGTGVVRFGPRIRYPDGSIRQHGAIPRDGAFIEVTGYRHGGGARGNVGARTLTVMRTAVPVRQRRHQPRARHRRRRRRDGRQGQGPRPADAAHRPARRHRRATSSG